MHICPSTCHFFYSSDFLLFMINPQHQLFIESIFTNDTLFTIMQLLVQRKSTTSNHNQSNLLSLETDEEKKKPKLVCIVPEFAFLSCLPLSYYANLHSMPQLFQPSIARCRFIFHNTQTNKNSYACSQTSLKQYLLQLTNNDKIFFSVSMQKVDSH